MNRQSIYIEKSANSSRKLGERADLTYASTALDYILNEGLFIKRRKRRKRRKDGIAREYNVRKGEREKEREHKIQ